MFYIYKYRQKRQRIGYLKVVLIKKYVQIPMWRCGGDTSMFEDMRKTLSFKYDVIIKDNNITIKEK